MAIIKGWKKEERKNATIWIHDNEIIGYRKVSKDQAKYQYDKKALHRFELFDKSNSEYGLKTPVFYWAFRTKEEALKNIMFYMRQSVNRDGNISGSKFKIGDKVHYTDGSWQDSDNKSIINATVVSMKMTKADQVESGEAGIYYTLRPTVEMLQLMYDVDQEEIANEMFSQQGSMLGKYIKKGWHKDPGYQ